MGKIKRSPVWDDPRVKPPYGSVAVDWTHPLASGLLMYLPMSEGGGAPTDIARYSAAARVGSPTWNPTLRGQAFTCPTNNDYATVTPAATQSFGRISVFLSMRITSGNSGYVLTLNTGSLFLLAPGIVFGSGFHFFDGGWLTGTNTVTDGNWHSVVCVVEQKAGAGGIKQTYRDGILDASGVSAENSATWTVANVGQRVGTAGFPGGQIAYIGIASRLMGLDQAAWLHAEPYALLRPIITRRYFTSQGAAAGSTVRRRLMTLGVGS